MTSSAHKPLVKGSPAENFDFFGFAVCKNVKKRASDDETKIIAGQVLTYNSKNFY